MGDHSVSETSSSIAMVAPSNHCSISQRATDCFLRLKLHVQLVFTFPISRTLESQFHCPPLLPSVAKRNCTSTVSCSPHRIYDSQRIIECDRNSCFSSTAAPSMQAESDGKVTYDNKKKEYKCPCPEKVCKYPVVARVKCIIYASAIHMARTQNRSFTHAN